MTREEMFVHLNALKHITDESSMMWLALDMAIKSLEQEPCEDAISRQEVLKQINYWTIGSREHAYVNTNYLIKRIQDIQPVIPHPKTGHWIKYGVPRCGEQHYKCTSCGYYINFGQWGEVYTKQFKYCPNCSAKMIKPQESEEV